MKKAALLIILAGILVLSGCSIISGPVCNKPYIHVGKECCVDSDDNSICDIDDNLLLNASSLEKLKAELKEEIAVQLKNSSAKSGPNLELTADYCYFSDFQGNFQCPYGFLWNDGVEFKIKSSTSGRVVLKKIWFTELDCGIVLPKNESYELLHDEEIIFDIPCNITKSSVYNNKIELTYDYYHQKSGGGYYEESSETTTYGELGGLVRDRETHHSDSAAQVALVNECETSQWPLTCTRHDIGKDYIEIRLKSTYRGIIVPKHIEFLSVPCGYSFENLSKEDGFKLNEERTFNIKCDIRR